MTPRERVMACLSKGCPDEAPMRDAPLTNAMARWRREDMPEGGFPSYFFENAIDGCGYDSSLRLPTEVLEDDGRKRIAKSSNGVTYMELPGTDVTSHPMDFLIKTREDWQKYKDRITPDISRMGESTVNWYKELSAKQETWLCVVFSGPYGCMCSLVGTPNALEVMAVEPEWFLDVAQTYTDFHIGMMELLRSEGVKLDGIFMDDDITFITGPFFSPAMFRELVMPSAKRLYGYVHDFGGHVYRHTDGNNWKFIPLMIEAGIDFLDPLEVKATMDLQQLKEAFDRQLVWVGNIDARILYRGDKKEIEEEAKKKLSVFPEGGYLFRTDGPITDEASFEAYSFLIECLKKYGKYG